MIEHVSREVKVKPLGSHGDCILHNRRVYCFICLCGIVGINRMSSNVVSVNVVSVNVMSVNVVSVNVMSVKVVSVKNVSYR